MELDDLKSAWKTAPSEKKYNKVAIFEMMKKKSTSTIKSIFIFTSIEFLLVIVFTILSLIKGKLLLGNGINFEDDSFYSNYVLGSALTIAFTFFFLAFTYFSYRKINVNNTVAGLIQQIVKFRKVINAFILFIVISLIAISIPYYFNLGHQLYAEKIGANYDIEKANTVGYISITVAVVFILFITSIYYSFIYWFFLRKLSKNLNELNDIK